MIGEAAEKIKNHVKQWLIKNHTTSPWKNGLQARQTPGGGRPAPPARTSTDLRPSRRDPATGLTRPDESPRWPRDRRGTRGKRRRRSAKNKGASGLGEAADRPIRPHEFPYPNDSKASVTCRRASNSRRLQATTRESAGHRTNHDRCSMVFQIR